MSDLENTNDEDINVEGIEGFESEPVRTPNKRDKIKAHFKKHKTTYIAVGTAIVAVAATVLVMKKINANTTVTESATTVVRQTNFKSDVVNKITTQNLVRRGHPGRIVYWLEGDKTFSSIAQAAEETGLTREQISKALRGLIPDANGNHFRDLGDMI